MEKAPLFDLTIQKRAGFLGEYSRRGEKVMG
jgi:hypothetical protein